MNNFDPAKYTILIKSQVVDKEVSYVGRVMELPDVCVYEDTFQDAYTSLLSIVYDLKETSDENGVFFPKPFNIETEYSGNLSLRLPKDLHKQIAYISELEGCSLNQFIITCLAQHIGQKKVLSDIKSTFDHLISKKDSPIPLFFGDVISTFGIMNFTNTDTEYQLGSATESKSNIHLLENFNLEQKTHNYIKAYAS